jgi:hypothetical protein
LWSFGTFAARCSQGLLDGQTRSQGFPEGFVMVEPRKPKDVRRMSGVPGQAHLKLIWKNTISFCLKDFLMIRQPNYLSFRRSKNRRGNAV